MYNDQKYIKTGRKIFMYNDQKYISIEQIRP